jgi:hypothetical protein
MYRGISVSALLSRLLDRLLNKRLEGVLLWALAPVCPVMWLHHHVRHTMGHLNSPLVLYLFFAIQRGSPEPDVWYQLLTRCAQAPADSPAQPLAVREVCRLLDESHADLAQSNADLARKGAELQQAQAELALLRQQLAG